MNCISCKWQRLKDDDKFRRQKGVTVEETKAACAECVESFKARCAEKPPTCLTCEWKDRKLPFEARKLHCKACVEAFASAPHECGKCPWNNPKRQMPTDAALAHCKACLAHADGKTAMNCESCAWRNTPAAVRTRYCAACSLKFASNSKVVGSTNELSNKGQIIESYDNHNASMTDDRDTVTQIRGDYTEAMKSGSKPGMRHPVFDVADRCGMSIEEFAQNAYEDQKRFLYELSALTDQQALLFLSTVRGEKQTDFAKNHGISSTAVNALFKQLIFRSETFKRFILLSRGKLEGTRGRKPKSGSRIAHVPKKTKKITYCGVSQLSFAM